MNIRTKKYMAALAVLIIVAGAGLASTASADTAAPVAASGTMQHGRGMMGMRKPGVFGTVTAISGNTITVTSKQFAPRQKPAAGSATTAPTTPPAATTVTYTIDATSATVTKAGAASSVSSIAVGDTIMAQGTVTGTSVAATAINDGVMKGMGGGMMGGKGAAGAGLSALPAGNGQPIVGGSVTAVSGTSVTITNTAGVTYTVDASAAKFTKPGVTAATIANLTVGDQVVVQGAVNGSAVTAATIIDSGAKPAPKTTTNANGTTTTKQPQGFFGAIGGFFAHLFGF